MPIRIQCNNTNKYETIFPLIRNVVSNDAALEQGAKGAASDPGRLQFISSAFPPLSTTSFAQ